MFEDDDKDPAARSDRVYNYLETLPAAGRHEKLIEEWTESLAAAADGTTDTLGRWPRIELFTMRFFTATPH
jgi:hypothetical protein